jgi:hypothetical protein
VCWLKGFIQRTLPAWAVNVLDLNLATHQELFAIVQQRLCLSGPAYPEGLLGDIALLRAAETFRGEHGDEFYNCPDRYTQYADLWLRFVPSELTNYRLLEQAYEGRVPMPAPIEARAEQVLREQPAVTGISVAYAQQIWFALCLAKAMKRRSPVPIVVGGTFFNGDAETAWTARFPEVDYVVSGEGEQALAELLASGDPQRVPGLSYRQEGRVVKNPPVFQENLDLLGEPDFSDLDLRAYYCPRPVAPVLTSRGCYWRRCAFCVHYKSAGQTYRRRSVAAVVQELKRHVERGVQHFALADEMIAPAYFSQLAEAIIAAGLKLYYYAIPGRPTDSPCKIATNLNAPRA